LKCETLEAGGRLFPVDVRYADKPSQEEPWDRAAAALEGLMIGERGRANPQAGGRGENSGDILIFMPGMFEITRTIEACKRRIADDDLSYFPLHGTLPPAQQDAAVAPAVRGKRKVIVSTNVAQTSITIEGVTTVIDSGLARIHRYDPQRALNVLRLEPISRASADQRAGRAGRTAPGVCIRLWTPTDHARREEHDEPEVLRLELSEAALQLKSMGVEDLRGFAWIEPPPGQAIDGAEELLRELKALDDRGRITALGQRMADFPAHPRLARMMLDAAERGCLNRAVVWASLISERDILAQPRQSVLLKYLEKDEPPSDLAARERLFHHLKRQNFGLRECQAVGASAITCREVERTADLYIGVCKRQGLPIQGADRTIDLLHALLTAFPDHVAMRLDPQRLHGAMPGRRKVIIDRETVVREAGPLVALEVTQVGRKDDATTNISLCSAIDPAWLRELHPELLITETKLTYNPTAQAVEEAEITTFGGLELSRVSRPPTNHAAAAELLAQQIIAGALRLDQWDEHVQQWIWRTRFVAGLFPERGLITYNEEDLAVIMQEIVGKAVRFSQVRDKPCLPAIKEALGWDDQQFVEKMAPESIALPRGKRLRIEYFADQPPRGRAKIQELYDLPDTPKIAGGRHTIVLEILGPNYRPVQLTTDLKGFWERLYPELKKELKRRYPRHEWR